MEVTAWNNGKHYSSGAGYGLKLAREDRDRFFQKSWKSVYIALPGSVEKAEINTNKESFWNTTCRELISHEIGKWLISKGYAHWPRGRPPKFRLIPKKGNHFVLEAV